MENNDYKNVLIAGEETLLTVNSLKSKTKLVWGIILLPVLVGIILLILYSSGRRNELSISKDRVFGRLNIDGTSKDIGTVFTSVPINKVTFVAKNYTNEKKNKGYVYIGSASTFIKFGLTDKCNEIYDLIVSLTCLNSAKIINHDNLNNNEPKDNNTFKSDIFSSNNIKSEDNSKKIEGSK